MRFRSRGQREFFFWPFVSDTTPKCIDREGLGRRQKSDPEKTILSSKELSVKLANKKTSSITNISLFIFCQEDALQRIKNNFKISPISIKHRLCTVLYHTID